MRWQNDSCNQERIQPQLACVWYTGDMHELSIAHNLVELADAAARNAGATNVVAVHLRLGAMAGVVEDALRFSFPLAATGTRVEGAALIVEHVPVRIFCTACDAEHTLASPNAMRCPVCAMPAARLIQGREIQLDTIEIEEAAHAAAHP